MVVYDPNDIQVVLWTAVSIALVFVGLIVNVLINRFKK